MISLKKTMMSKKGIGIAEVLVSAAVLGFMCVALNKLQGGNHETFLRIRGRDGAVEVAQQVLDSLQSVGVAAIPVADDPTKDTVFTIDNIERSWKRGLGGNVVVAYTPTITVSPANEYLAKNKTNYDNDIQHTYAKQVNVQVGWKFKGTTQSINVSGVVR